MYHLDYSHKVAVEGLRDNADDVEVGDEKRGIAL